MIIKERKLTKYHSYMHFGFKFASCRHVDATVQTKSNAATLIEGQITYFVRVQ